MPIKRAGVLTGGGDCPGLNAAVRAITRKGILDYSWEVIGIQDGYEGLIEGQARPLTSDDVANILPRGGTILGTSNKASPFDLRDGKEVETERTKKALANIDRWGLDALFCIGGDGTLTIAAKLAELWPNVIGLPKTIDNDLRCTDQTFGFDTACAFVTDALDRLHTTADAHHRVMVVEVMGRYAGWIALEGGLAGGGDVILIPEMPFSRQKVISAIEERSARGKRSSIVVVSEGAHAAGEKHVVDSVVSDSPDPIRLGGIGKHVATFIEEGTGHESRVAVLGHMQRGGSPSFYDRVLATGCGTRAAELAAEGMFGNMVALRGKDLVPVPLGEATCSLKLVTPDHRLVTTAKAVGASFGI
ncbi:MAG: 6-phosphofructokinase [Proteobacteria bacterium]|nr:6-phosphofructokinase [Pseudomonadota bacterium]